MATSSQAWRGAPLSAAAAEGAFVQVAAALTRLEAPLTFVSVAALHQPGIALIKAAGSELTFDLERVPAVDSAGLALLIDWLATARNHSCQLRFANPPAALLALARLSELEKLLTG